MLAALEGNTTIGLFLVEHGADVAALNNIGESALSIAAHKGHLPFVKLLKSRGASADVRPHGHDLETWVRNASGLPQAKVQAILEACEDRVEQSVERTGGSRLAHLQFERHRRLPPVAHSSWAGLAVPGNPAILILASPYGINSRQKRLLLK